MNEEGERNEDTELEPLTSRMPADLAEYVRQRAKRERRSVSAELVKIVEEARERERRAS